MSLEAFLTSALFKRDQEGRTIVYPNGAIGSGYFVPDAATEQSMRRLLMWLVIGCASFGGLMMAALMGIYGDALLWTAKPWIITVLALVLFNLAYRSLARYLTRGMVPATERMRMIEACKRQAEAMPRWYLWFNAVFGPILLVGSVFYLAMMQSLAAGVLGTIGIILFGVATVQAIYGLSRRMRAAMP